MIATLLAMTLAAVGVEGVQEAPPRLTVEEWRKLPDRQRYIILVGGMEGLLLAASGPNGDQTGIDQACLSSASLPQIDAKLNDEAMPAETPIALAIMEATQCTH